MSGEVDGVVGWWRGRMKRTACGRGWGGRKDWREASECEAGLAGAFTLEVRRCLFAERIETGSDPNVGFPGTEALRVFGTLFLLQFS